MTPMQKLKNQFDEFKLSTPDFKELTLNKSEPKTSHSGWCGEYFTHHDKGVKSDFVKMYRIKFNAEESFSIGFIFSYLDVPEELQTVTVSVKKGALEFFKGSEQSVKDFRDTFKVVLDELKQVEKIDYKNVIELFQKEFNLLYQEPGLKKHGSGSQKKHEKIIKPKRKNILG